MTSQVRYCLRAGPGAGSSACCNTQVHLLCMCPPLHWGQCAVFYAVAAGCACELVVCMSDRACPVVYSTLGAEVLGYDWAEEVGLATHCKYQPNLHPGATILLHPWHKTPIPVPTPRSWSMRLQRLRRGAVQRLLRITAFVEWSTAISCELLMLCRHLLRGPMVCDVMTDCYPV